MHALFYLVNLYKQNWYIFMVSVRNGTKNPSCTHITHHIQTLTSRSNTSFINMGCTSTACTTWWYQLTKFISLSWYVLQCANHTCHMQQFWCNDANTPTYCAIHIKRLSWKCLQSGTNFAQSFLSTRLLLVMLLSRIKPVAWNICTDL